MEAAQLVFLLGRLVLGIYFLRAAKSHLVNSRMLANYAASQGVPSPRFAVIGSGLLLLAGGLGIILGVYVIWALLALVIFLVPVTFQMHAFWKVSDPNTKMMQSVNFWKNLALLGAVLMLFALPTPWPSSLF